MSNVISVKKFNNSVAGHRARRKELIDMQARQIHYNKLCAIAVRLDDPELYRLTVNYKDIHINGGCPILTPLENALKEATDLINNRDGAA